MEGMIDEPFMIYNTNVNCERSLRNFIYKQEEDKYPWGEIVSPHGRAQDSADALQGLERRGRRGYALTGRTRDRTDQSGKYHLSMSEKIIDFKNMTEEEVQNFVTTASKYQLLRVENKNRGENIYNWKKYISLRFGEKGENFTKKISLFNNCQKFYILLILEKDVDYINLIEREKREDAAEGLLILSNGVY